MKTLLLYPWKLRQFKA